MERNHFMPHTALPGNDGMRDLPPADRARMEQSPPPMDLAPEEGCGCDHDHDHGDGGNHSVCVGYEGCGEGSWGLAGYPLAMVYAPCQAYRALYDPVTALHRGTLFTELDLPLGSAEGSFTTAAQGCACRTDRRGL